MPVCIRRRNQNLQQQKQQQQTGKHLCTFQKNAKYYIYNDSSTHIKVGLIIVIP